MDKKDYPEAMSRRVAALYLDMSERNLSRLIKIRILPFLRTQFSKDPIKGRILFSKKKLDDYERRYDEIYAEFPKTKEMWWIMYAPVMDAEREEQVLIVRILELSAKLKDLLDGSSNLGNDFDEMFSEYSEKVAVHSQKEKQRIREFFDNDEEVLFRFFPKTFRQEIKIKEEAEAKQAEVKEMRGGIRVDRYESSPGTLVPKKQNIQVEQSQADEGRMVYPSIDKDEE